MRKINFYLKKAREYILNSLKYEINVNICVHPMR